ncbi:DUF2255 family protein [Haladaptatus sp. T7]|uniref:DUF2255 family protein n=1 Tax=Haladaptatus sp. T7 TaxID=2029368 RepID=UPI0021A251D4|nr:DUF2255 family protein [Haladaptatus sp. T7]GKZ16017.1 hypothetical protein HAL_38980 [Haladaptatus sp. T7]
MTVWPDDELSEIVESDDLHIAPFREDGETYGTPTWIWSVRVGDSLYVRAYNGQNSSWYQAAIRENAGRIKAAGMTKEVTFESVDGAINDRIDEAYREKYEGSSYLSAMISDRARSATIEVMPRNPGI